MKIVIHEKKTTSYLTIMNASKPSIIYFRQKAGLRKTLIEHDQQITQGAIL